MDNSYDNEFDQNASDNHLDQPPDSSEPSDSFDNTILENSLSLRTYNLLIGVLLLLGFGLNYLLCHYYSAVFMHWSPLLVGSGYLSDHRYIQRHSAGS